MPIKSDFPDDGYFYCEGSTDEIHIQPAASTGCEDDPGVGDPIYPLSGIKRQSEVLGNWVLAGRPVTLDYSTQVKLPDMDPDSIFSRELLPAFGPSWTSNFQKAIVGGNGLDFQIYRGNGRWIRFNAVIDRQNPTKPAIWVPEAETLDHFEQYMNPPYVGTRYTDVAGNAAELFDGSGLPLGVAYFNGKGLLYGYSDDKTPIEIAPKPGLLISVQDQNGRAVKFQYETQEDVPRINKCSR
ncbi:hypothetical protein ACQUJT_23785 [Ralstonia pseudosolanacearum]